MVSPVSLTILIYYFQGWYLIYLKLDVLILRLIFNSSWIQIMRILHVGNVWFLIFMLNIDDKGCLFIKLLWILSSWYQLVYSCVPIFCCRFLILIFNRYEHGAITEELNLFLSAISIWTNLSFYKLMIS